MDVVARQPVRRGDQDHLELGHRCSVAQGVEAGTVQIRAAVTFIQVKVLFLKRPTLPFGVALQSLYLLVDLLSLRLSRSRDPGVDRHSHPSFPPFDLLGSVAPPIRGGAGRLGPSGGQRRFGPPSCVGRSTLAPRVPPRSTSTRGGYPRRFGFSFSLLWREKQNLSFVISPSRRSSRAGNRGVTGARRSHCERCRRRRRGSRAENGSAGVLRTLEWGGGALYRPIRHRRDRSGMLFSSCSVGYRATSPITLFRRFLMVARWHKETVLLAGLAVAWISGERIRQA